MKYIHNITTLIALTAFLFVGAGFVQAQGSNQSTTAIGNLQKQINALQQKVQQLQEQLANQNSDASAGQSKDGEDDQQASSTPGEAANSNKQSLPAQALSAMPSFVRQRLQFGERSQAVRELQEFLAQSPEIYPQGLTTGYYGPLTSQAVKRLKQRAGLSSDGRSIGPDTFQQIRTLLQEGAGQSGIIPPGLKKAPGIQRLLADATSSQATTSSDVDAATTATTSQNRRGPDINRLPIDGELKDRLRSIMQEFGGQDQAEEAGPPAHRGPFGSPSGNQ